MQEETGTFTVYKHFSDGNQESVGISLSCTSGTVVDSPQLASMDDPAIFNVEGVVPGTTCTAEEIDVPDGYVKDETDCQDGDALNGNCTIINTPEPISVDFFMVRKDFTDDNPESVLVGLTCSSGSVVNSPLWISEAVDGVFEIEGAESGATCTASELSVPSGYEADETDCQDGDAINGGCMIINSPEPVTVDYFTVFKDFSDDDPRSVQVSLSCSSGVVLNSPQFASESTPAVFTIEGASVGSSCVATEDFVPENYVADMTDCQDQDGINQSCTLLNTAVVITEEIIRYANFETGSAPGWSFSGNVSVDGVLAVDQYSLRHEIGSSSSLSVSTIGYDNVNISMRLAGSSLKKSHVCSGEVSTDSGSSWKTVVSVANNQTEGKFYSGSMSLPEGSNISDLQVRFTATGRGKKSYCYGDEILITGSTR